MSDWKRHIIGGAVFCIPIFMLFIAFNIALTIGWLIFLPIIFIYSQLPDIDTPASKIRSILTILGLGIAFISIVFLHNNIYAIVSLGTVIIIWIAGFLPWCRHRGIFHTLLMGIILSAFLILISIEAAIVGLVSYISHLILDKRKKK